MPGEEIAPWPEEGPVVLPQVVTTEWVLHLQQRFDAASRAGATELKDVLPRPVAVALFARVERLLQTEPTLLELLPAAEDSLFTVVGDTHGQFHDVCNMLEVVGRPSEQRTYVFNGDFVDRGAWGIETLAMLCCWKLALPRHVFLLRGNHESATCTLMYGFKGELVAKYGRGGWKPVYTACKKLFAALPLAALINRQTLVLHGGLFRAQPQRAGGKRKRVGEVVLGTLDDLRRASKGGLDPAGVGAGRLATDVLWSDPMLETGFQENDARGIGMIFGPEITEEFLRHNGLKLILRSHEGPDAREDRPGMGSMLEGYTLDHQTQSGRLMTVFSAPDYPQFMADDSRRFRNKAAVAELSAPDYATPEMRQYGALLPRPASAPYYELWVPDSDEEYEPAASDLSGMTDVRAERSGNDGGEGAEQEEEGEAAAGKASPASDEKRASSLRAPHGESPRRARRASPVKWPQAHS